MAIDADKADACVAAVAALEKEGKLSPDIQRRQAQHLNDRLEADHGKLKCLIRPAPGFQATTTTPATIKVFEVIRALEKG